MRITGGIQNVSEIYTKENRVNKINNVDKVEAPKDDVKISATGKDFSIAMNAVKNVPDVREDKVNDIRSRIENGTYNVSGKDVAEKLLG